MKSVAQSARLIGFRACQLAGYGNEQTSVYASRQKLPLTNCRRDRIYIVSSMPETEDEGGISEVGQ